MTGERERESGSLSASARKERHTREYRDKEGWLNVFLVGNFHLLSVNAELKRTYRGYELYLEGKLVAGIYPWESEPMTEDSIIIRSVQEKKEVESRVVTA